MSFRRDDSDDRLSDLFDTSSSSDSDESISHFSTAIRDSSDDDDDGGLTFDEYHRRETEGSPLINVDRGEDSGDQPFLQSISEVSGTFRRDISEIFHPEKKKQRKIKAKMSKYARLEQGFWDNSYDSNPNGEIDVADVLQLILLFLPSHRPTLLAVTLVCPAWFERATGLPQWSLQAPTKALTVAPPPRVRSVVDVSDAQLLGMRVAVTSRETYLKAKLRNYQEARSQKCQARWERTGFSVGWITMLVAVFALCMYVAYAVGMNRSPAFDTQSKVGAATFFFILMIAIVAALVLAVGVNGTCLHKYHRRSGYGVPATAAATVFMAGTTICLVLGVCVALVAMRAATLREESHVPYFNTSCPPPNGTHYTSDNYPYYVVFPRKALHLWKYRSVPDIYGHPHANFTLPEAGVPFSKVRVQYLRPELDEAAGYMCPSAVDYYRTLVFNPTQYAPSAPWTLATLRGVGVIVSTQNSTWWTDTVRQLLASAGRTAGSSSGSDGDDDADGDLWLPTPRAAGFDDVHHSTLPNLTWSPIPPLWLKPQVSPLSDFPPQPAMGIPLVGIERVPAGGTITTNQGKWERTLHVMLIVSASLFGASLLTFFAPRMRHARRCFTFWAVVACLSLNIVNMIVFGANCKWGTHDYCLMTKHAAGSMFWFSSTVVFLLFAYKVWYENCR